MLQISYLSRSRAPMTPDQLLELLLQSRRNNVERGITGMLLYGMSMVYGATGTLQVGDIAGMIARGEGNRTVLVFGLVFIVAGLGFKLGVVPFHMWVPDVYHGAPTAVTLLISSAPKIAAFAFFMRILGEALGGLAADWRSMLVVMAVLSLALGNIAAIAQTNLKRMLAYSSISHMGFLLLGFLAGNAFGFAAAMFYCSRGPVSRRTRSTTTAGLHGARPGRRS